MLKRIALATTLLLPTLLYAQNPPPAYTPPPSAPPSSSPDGMPRTGLVIDARLGFATTVSSSLVGNNSPSFVALPTVDFGVRLVGRLQLTLGFTLFRTAISMANADTAVTAFTFNPQIAVDIIKSADDKVAFYAIGGVPLGGLFIDNPGTANNQRHFVIGYNVGVGARIALHHMFALGLEGGVFGIFSDVANNTSIGITSVYGALIGTFYYDLGK
jgi:hypothetical protein